MQATSAFDFMYGVDHGPMCDTGVDVSAELLDMGATLIRTHDSGVGGSLPFCKRLILQTDIDLSLSFVFLLS